MNPGLGKFSNNVTGGKRTKSYSQARSLKYRITFKSIMWSVVGILALLHMYLSWKILSFDRLESKVKIEVLTSTLQRPHDTDTDAENNADAADDGDTRLLCFHDGTECRYDEVGKYLEASSKFTMIHEPSDAIDPSRRIPSNQGSNETYIANRRLKGPKDGSLTMLAEYNPSILPLTSDMDEKLLDYLTGRYHPDISDEEADKVKYLYISRSANFHHCIQGLHRLGLPTKEQSYLTLTILDESLQPIPEASAAVRPYEVLTSNYCIREKELDPFQDFQIIAMRSTKGNDKKDQLFMISSDANSYIFAIDLRRVPVPTNNSTDWDTKVKGNPVKMVDIDKPNLFYGKGLQVRFWVTGTKRKNKCFYFLFDNSLDFRKNYHVFEAQDPKTGHIKTYMEMRPFGPRAVREVNFYAEKFHEAGDWELVPNGTFSKPDSLKRDEKDIIHDWKEAKENWLHLFPFNSKLWVSGGRWRGTACCVDVEFNDYETLKVGIAHIVSKKRGYVSRFYAFDTKNKNFSIVATSGPFCLGSMKEHDLNAKAQIFPMADSVKLNLSNVEFDCPQITFASGIAEYQADKNYIVISYGVNDCYSRSIVVSKKRIRELLIVNRPKMIANTTHETNPK